MRRLIDNPEVDIITNVRCRCGKVTGAYQDAFIEHVYTNRGDPVDFYNRYGIRRLCCRTSMMSFIPISRGAEYYDLELIEGRASLAEKQSSAKVLDVVGSLGALTLIDERGSTPPPRPQVSPPDEPLSGTGLMKGGGYIGRPPPDVVPETISGQSMEPVLFTGQYREIKSTDGTSYQVPIVRATLSTTPHSLIGAAMSSYNLPRVSTTTRVRPPPGQVSGTGLSTQ